MAHLVKHTSVGALLTLSLALFSCEPPGEPVPDPELTLLVEADDEAAALALAEAFPFGPVRVSVVSDPAAALGTDEDSPLSVALVSDLTTPGAFRLEHHAEGAIVHGAAPLGIQYGLYALYEAAGARFFHPARTHRPDTIVFPSAADRVWGVEHSPALDVRGLHLHTLHPTEAYFAFLEPGEENLAQAKAIIDWVIANRGNLVQWWLLNDLKQDVEGERHEHMRSIIEYAHARGVRTGVGVQLFNAGNLQRGFDLTGGGAAHVEEIAESFTVLDGLGFDAIKISFGEFSAVGTEQFIEILDAAIGEAHSRWPDIEVTASVHVGADLRVDYGGEEDLLYYHLVRFADPRITPWIHTVMYYTLFDPASGVYHHEDFSEHRAYLYERLALDAPVAYYPESAYWVAFDNSVPTYLPVYLRARLRDQWLIRDDVEAMGLSPLRQHVTFSSGWEWGYWQNDYVVLRSNYELPETLLEMTSEMFSVYGEDGERAASAVDAVAALQFETLVEGELGAYLAGVDTTIEAGFDLGIVGAADRTRFSELVEGSDEERRAFETSVVAPLRALADGTDAQLQSLGARSSDAFLAELFDGLAIDVARARFVASVYEAAIASGDGRDPSPALSTAEAERDRSLTIVARRAEGFFDPEPERLTARRVSTRGFYQYGYLREARTLCFWERELIQVRNLVLGETETVPACVL